jgi:hypothetical protein
LFCSPGNDIKKNQNTKNDVDQKSVLRAPGPGIYMIFFSLVVEHLLCKQKARGSNPSAGFFFVLASKNFDIHDCDVTGWNQPVDCEVEPGSISVMTSKSPKRKK